MIRDFDTVTYLDSKDIQYWSEGKNISKNWIGIGCPFCADISNHCGIHLESGIFSCWICGEKGNVIKLVRELEECSFRRAKQIVEQFGENFSVGDGLPFLSVPDAAGKRSRSKEVLPIACQKTLPNIHIKYLRSRKFSPEYLTHKYKIQAVHTIGKYRFRIIAPFFLDRKIVTFIARDVTDKADKKYLACPNDESIIPVGSTFYNIDNAGESVVIVEGITDVWRIGDGAIAASGLNLTDEQLAMLIDKGVNKVGIVFDKGAEDKADRYAERLSSIIDDIKIHDLSGGDPADQREEVIKEIRKLI